MGFINTADPQPSGSGNDLIGVAVHELAEELGILMLAGAKFSTPIGRVSGFAREDLMSFAAPGVPMLTSEGLPLGR